MARPQLLVTRRLPSAVMSLLDSRCAVEVFDRSGAMPHDELLARVHDKDALIAMVTDTIDGTLIAAGVSLKIIANVAVGYNNIDVQAARARGIVVTNTPDVLTDATADLAWALILGITRRVGEGERLVRKGQWKGWAFDQLLGMSLRGKQLGIVGYGRIGQAVAARADAFGMHVVYASRSADSDNTHPAVMSMDHLLATSDIVTLHVPLSDETHHLIDQTALARMKRTAYLVNTSRGPVVDEKALVWALRNRLIAGAALDVYEHEPDVEPTLLTFENVLLTPHLGSATTDTRTAMADLAARNVLAVLSGETPLTPVP